MVIMPRIISSACVGFLALTFAAIAADEAAARYTGSGPACVSGVGQGDRLNVRSRPNSHSRVLGSLAPGQCDFNIESVEGGWTFIRGSDRGRNVQGWVANRFLRAKNRQHGSSGGGHAGGFPIRAASGGGVIRSGPGVNFRRLGSTREFEPVTVLRNTGVMMNNFPWFEIRYRNGRRGFQWGGLICSTGRAFAGTFDTCTNFRASLQGNNNPPPSNQPTRRRVAYSCNEGIPLQVTFVDDNRQDFAIYSYDSGPQIRLRSQVSGSGFAYGDGFNELIGKANEILLLENGQTVDSCVAN